MTKAELVEKMAKEAEISKVAAAAALDSFMDGVQKALKKKTERLPWSDSGLFQKSGVKLEKDVIRRQANRLKSRQRM